MKHLSRRDFIHAGCTVAAASLSPPIIDKAEAYFHHGYIPPVNPNGNRATINIIHSSSSGIYKNLAKGISWNLLDPTSVPLSSNGYPTSASLPGGFIAGNQNMPAAYYGEFVWKYTGPATVVLFGVGPMVVSSGGTSVGLAGSAGDFPQGNNITNTTGGRVQFAFGFNIQSISNNGSGLIRIGCKTGYLNSGGGDVFTGRIVNITGANSNTGANGLWQMVKVDNQTFDLLTVAGGNSVFTNAQASSGGTAVLVSTQITFRITAGSATFDNLVWCKTADEGSSQIISDTLIAQLQALTNQGTASFANRNWLRFMDVVAVQASFESDFSQRTIVNQLCYTVGAYRPGYWIGAVTNGGSDDYICSDPSISVWNGSSYIDNAIVQGLPSATNTGGVPTLNVGGHGAKPVFCLNSSSGSVDGAPPLIVGLTSGAPTPGTDVLSYSFQASWLNGGVAVPFSYSTIAGDGTLSTLVARLQAALAANATLKAAGIQFQNTPGANSFGPFVTYGSAQAGRLTITYTSGPAISEIWNCKKSQIPTTGATFIYNYLLDGWIMLRGGSVFSIPFEVLVEMCNRVGSHCWFNWGTTKGSFITAVTQFFGDSTTGLTSGLRFGGEVANEVWNSGAQPYQFFQNIGCTLGWTLAANSPNYSYTALRTIQYGALSKTAWTGKGRSASDFYMLLMGPEFDVSLGGAFSVAQLQGTYLSSAASTLTAAYYSNYGGLNGSGTAPNYTAAGSRPVDIATAIGFAPYWGSKWWNTTASNITGAMSNHAAWLQASLDYVNGNTATAFTSLTNQFNGTTTRPSGSSGALTFGDYATVMTNEETLAASFDSFRSGAGIPNLGVMHYEGGNQWAVGNNGVNGTNSVTDTGPLTTQITSLISGSAWDVSPYTVSGTNSASEISTQVLKLIMGWKNDTDVSGNAAGLGSYKNLIKTNYYQVLKTTSGSNREAKPAHYGYFSSTWGFYPGDFNANNPYQNFNAVQEWNAGN